MVFGSLSIAQVITFSRLTDDGTVKTYTVTFNKSPAFTGSGYVGDLVQVPTLGTLTSGSLGNVLYAYSGYGNIHTDKSSNGLTTVIVDGAEKSAIQLRESGTLTAESDTTVIRDYTKSLAGNAFQLIDIDISSRDAVRFTADAGVDWNTRPDTGSAHANGPIMKFQVWAHKNISQLDTEFYGQMAPTATGGTISSDGWVLLAESPNQSSGCYTGAVTHTNNLYEFDVPLTYVENGEEKSYQALRLVMDTANNIATRDEGIWGSPYLEFAEPKPLSLNVRGADVTEDGASADFLITSTGEVSVDYQTIVAVYDENNQMIGFSARDYNTAVDTNIDGEQTVPRDVYFENESSLSLLLWDKATQAPIYGEHSWGVPVEDAAYQGLPIAPTKASDPKIDISIDKGQVTVTGTGFAPSGVLTLLASQQEDVDHAAQFKADDQGGFTYEYRSNFCLEAAYDIAVTVGGYGLDVPVTATSATTYGHVGLHYVSQPIVLGLDGTPLTELPESGDIEIYAKACFPGGHTVNFIIAVYDENDILVSDINQEVELSQRIRPIHLPVELPAARDGVKIKIFAWEPVIDEPLANAVSVK